MKRALTSISARLFVPHQAAKEFLTRRLTVTAGQAEEYTKAIKTIRDLLDILSNKKRHPFLAEEDMPKFKADADRLVAQLEAQRGALLDSPHSDEILEFIESIVKDRIGNPFDEAELKALAKEGEARYQNGIPPGYKDGKKEPDGDVYRKFGDLIIWKQLIAKAKTAEMPVIFITDDKKEDWWLEQSGKTVGPRTELREEFISLVKRDFWMYTVDRFLEENARVENTTVNQNAISEIKTVSDDIWAERADRVDDGALTTRLQALSAREHDVIAMLALDIPEDEIAEVLHVHHNTVTFHIVNAMRKLGLTTRSGLISYWCKHGPWGQSGST